MTQRERLRSGFLAATWRIPMAWLRDVCGGEAAFPLVVLFGLNAVDELDRTAFGDPAAEHPRRVRPRQHQGARPRRARRRSPHSRCRFRSPSSPTARKRVPLAIAGAVVWALFSGMTGLATGVVVLMHRPQRQLDRQGGHRPDAQLAARRLLPDRTRAAGCSAPTAPPTPSARSSVRWSPVCSPTRSVGESRSWSSSSRR